jgi:hypothetical protein
MIMKFRVSIVLASLCLAFVTPALAAGKIYYGSRAGMIVTVVSMSGIGSEQAVIHTKHTKEDATAYCREYEGKVTAACVKEELEIRLSDQVTANCKTGQFSDFFGKQYQFLGKNSDKDIQAEYVIKDIVTGEIADGSSASGYDVNIDIIKALCPLRASSQ